MMMMRKGRSFHDEKKNDVEERPHFTIRERRFTIMRRTRIIIMMIKKMNSHDWGRIIHRVYWRIAGTLIGDRVQRLTTS
jgi:hypothetical protein